MNRGVQRQFFPAHSYMNMSSEPSLEYLEAIKQLPGKTTQSSCSNTIPEDDLDEVDYVRSSLDMSINGKHEEEACYLFENYDQSDAKLYGEIGGRTTTPQMGNMINSPHHLPAIDSDSNSSASSSLSSQSGYPVFNVPLSGPRCSSLDKAKCQRSDGKQTNCRNNPTGRNHMPKESMRTISPMHKKLGRTLKPLNAFRNSQGNEHSAQKSYKNRRSSMPIIESPKKLAPLEGVRRRSTGNRPLAVHNYGHTKLSESDSLDTISNISSDSRSNASTETSHEDLYKLPYTKPILKQSCSANSLSSEMDCMKRANLRVTFSDDLQIIHHRRRRSSMVEENSFLRETRNAHVTEDEETLWFQNLEVSARRRCSLPPLPPPSLVSIKAKHGDRDHEYPDEESDTHDSERNEEDSEGDVLCSVVHSFTPRPKPKPRFSLHEQPLLLSSAIPAPINDDAPNCTDTTPQPELEKTIEENHGTSLFDISDINTSFDNHVW